jgi:hypothetical protein
LREEHSKKMQESLSKKELKIKKINLKLKKEIKLHE